MQVNIRAPHLLFWALGQVEGKKPVKYERVSVYVVSLVYQVQRMLDTEKAELAVVQVCMS